MVTNSISAFQTGICPPDGQWLRSHWRLGVEEQYGEYDYETALATIELAVGDSPRFICLEGNHPGVWCRDSL